MCIDDFISPVTFNFMKNAVKAREKFEVKQTVKTKKNSYTLTVNSTVVDDKLAHDIWRDHNYLIHFNAEHSGSLGWGGMGFATDDYSHFDNWDAFKNWIDKSMKRYAEYEVDPLGQMCMF